MGLRKTPCFDVVRNPQTGTWDIVLVLGTKLVKKEAQAIAKQMEGNANAQEVLDRLNEGIPGRKY
jgi:hypothetical protein